MEIISNSVEETFAIGKRLGEHLTGGKILCLTGNLGSGKTTLIKGIAAGAGAKNPNTVNSPTFVMVNEYQGRFTIFHIDAYRIKSNAEFEALGFSDFLSPESVVIIEWADKVSDALKGLDCASIQMCHISQNSRGITLIGLDI